MLNQRSQNDVRITLISRCRRCQPIFNQISTSKRRRMPAGRLARKHFDKFKNEISPSYEISMKSSYERKVERYAG